jgi:hypothetical protein
MMHNRLLLAALACGFLAAATVASAQTGVKPQDKDNAIKEISIKGKPDLAKASAVDKKPAQQRASQDDKGKK